MIFDSSEGPECLWILRLTLKNSVFCLFSGRTNWERPRNMRVPQRAPSQCNISKRTLPLPLHCVFITDKQFTKKAKIIQEGGHRRSLDMQRLNSSSVVTDSAPALCIFLLPGNWNQDYWENITLSSWHFCTLHRFFSLNYKRKKNEGRKTKSKGFLFRRHCKISRDMNRSTSEQRHAGSRFRLHFYILKGKKDNNQQVCGKKRTKTRKCKPKKGLISVTMCMQSIWNQSHISTNLCFWQMLSVHSKGSLHMNVDEVRAKMLGLKYQCLTFVCMGVRGLLTTNWGLKRSPLDYCFVCTVFDFLMGPFLNVIFAGLTLCVLCLLNWIWIQCMCLSKMLLHAM